MAPRGCRRRSSCRGDRRGSLRRHVLTYYVKTMADLLARRRSLAGSHGRLVGVSSPLLRHFDDCLKQDCPSTPLAAEQSNSSVMLGNHAIVKFIRRFEKVSTQVWS